MARVKNLDIFPVIFSRLKKKKVFVNAASLKRHGYQGLMSTVYVVDSNRGELVVHLIDATEEWIKQRIWEKLMGIGALLMKFDEIPASEFLLSGKTGGRYFTVQKRLIGKPAGKRILKGNEVIDVWFGRRSKRYVPQVQRLLARTHRITREGYGWPRVIGNKLKGRDKNWRKFFERELPFWLKSIIYGDARLGKAEELKTSYVKIATLARTVAAHIVYAGPPVLIHGDAINPSNVLVRGNKVTGLLDWEWSMIGDPAWEFCDCGWWPLLDEKSLRPYLKEAGFTGTQAKNFLKRARTYRLLWILWGAHMHAKEKRVALYRALRKMLTEEASAIRN